MYFAVNNSYPYPMRIQFTKMVQFSLLVKAGDRLREFNFRRLSSNEAGTFSVNVCDERGNRIFFNMEKTEGDWKVVPVTSLPKWLEQTQSQSGLSNALDQELKTWDN
jgi:hypothetical protein